MKISNNALNFLLAQYRAIFKRAYIKGIASAVILTAGLAAGQAQADDPVYTAGLDSGNNFYFQYSGSGTWAEANNSASGAFVATDGIIAGALGGNGVNEVTSGTLTPEQGVTAVTDGDLVIDGVGGKDGSLNYVSSGTVAGGWANAKTSSISAEWNKVTLTGSGYVDKASASGSSRGMVFGGYAVSASGKASALHNQILVQDRTAEGLAKAAASHGLIGGRATGLTGAVANSNEVHVSGTETTSQILGLGNEFDVLGGHATSGKYNNATGAYTASQNNVYLQHVSASNVGATGNGLTIAGARITPSGTAAFTVGATGNKVSITDLDVTTASGSTDVNVFGAWSPYEVSGGTVTMADNTVTIADSNISMDADFKGVVRLVGAAVQGNKSAQVSLTGNKVTLTDSVNEQGKDPDNTIYAEIVAGAILDNSRSDNSKKLNATVTGNSVTVEDGIVINLAPTKGYIAGADIIVSGDKITAVTADDNSVTIAGDVTGSVYATRLLNRNNGSINTDNTKLSFLNNDVTLKTGGKVQSGSIVGGVGKDSVVTIENDSTYIANKGADGQDIASDVINISGTIQVEADNTLDISGFYKNGIVPSAAASAEYHDNLTTIASSAVIKNAEQITIYGKAVVEQGATLTGTAADSKIVVDASHGLKAKDQILLNDEDKVAGAGQGTLAIYNSTLQSYLKADQVLSQNTDDSAGMVQLTSGGVLEFRDTSNIDLATEFNFNHQAAAGAIVVDDSTGSGKGSIIRGNELTISRMLATNAVDPQGGNQAPTTYDGLDPATTAGINIEANVLHLGDSDLESWQSAEITFGSATFRDKLTFSAVNNGSSGSTGHETTINDGYHLVSETIGDHYRVVKTQADTDKNSTVAYYEAQDGVIEGDATIMGDSGSITIRNGNYTAEGALTIASGGTLSVGAADFNDDGTPDTDTHEGTTLLNAPDATLVLGQELTFDLNAASADAKVTVDGSRNGRYDAEAAAETLGDDRYVMLDLRQGVTILDDDDHNINGKATLEVKSGGEILLTATTVNSLLAQNNATNNGAALVAATSGSFLTASS